MHITMLLHEIMPKVIYLAAFFPHILVKKNVPKINPTIIIKTVITKYVITPIIQLPQASFDLSDSSLHKSSHINLQGSSQQLRPPSFSSIKNEINKLKHK